MEDNKIQRSHLWVKHTGNFLELKPGVQSPVCLILEPRFNPPGAVHFALGVPSDEKGEPTAKEENVGFVLLIPSIELTRETIAEFVVALAESQVIPNPAELAEKLLWKGN